MVQICLFAEKVNICFLFVYFLVKKFYFHTQMRQYNSRTNPAAVQHLIFERFFLVWWNRIFWNQKWYCSKHYSKLRIWNLPIFIPEKISKYITYTTNQINPYPLYSSFVFLSRDLTLHCLPFSLYLWHSFCSESAQPNQNRVNS